MQELAFRSAILYSGILISNAFGSVSKWRFHITMVANMSAMGY